MRVVTFNGSMKIFVVSLSDLLIMSTNPQDRHNTFKFSLMSCIGLCLCQSLKAVGRLHEGLLVGFCLCCVSLCGYSNDASKRENARKIPVLVFVFLLVLMLPWFKYSLYVLNYPGHVGHQTSFDSS